MKVSQGVCHENGYRDSQTPTNTDAGCRCPRILLTFEPSFLLPQSLAPFPVIFDIDMGQHCCGQHPFAARRGGGNISCSDGNPSSLYKGPDEAIPCLVKSIRPWNACELRKYIGRLLGYLIQDLSPPGR